MNTPWGRAQDVEEVAEGIAFVSTASHGGFHLSPERQKAMPSALRLDGGWYEEDCEAARVVLAFPQHFSAEAVAGARKTAKDWFPDAYAAFTGEPVPVEESHTLQLRAFDAEHKDDWVAIAAWGDWHPAVPEGMVACLATRGGIRDDEGEARFFLVPKDEYGTRKASFGFVIDLERHQEIGKIE